MAINWIQEDRCKDASLGKYSGPDLIYQISKKTAMLTKYSRVDRTLT